MLLDEWTDQELQLARAIGGERASAGRHVDGDVGLLDPLDVEAELQHVLERQAMEAGSEVTRDGCADTGHGHRAGIAREDGVAIVLDLKPGGGDGLLLSLQIDGRPARAWSDAQAWCDWLAPRLAVQQVQQIPPDLVGLLGQWALLALEPHTARAGLASPRFIAVEPGSCARAIAPTLTLRRADATLDLRLLDWPEHWIAALAQTMEDRRPRLSIPPIAVALAAGWTRLSRAQLTQLAAGDGVVLDHAVAVEHGHAWLIAERPLAHLRFDRGAWCVEHAYHENPMMQETADATLRGDPMADDNIVLTAVAEIGRLSMSLDTLRGLEAGQVLELTHATHGRVTLTVSGQAVAHGTLLRVGDKLVMRIE